ncbi:DUF3137 domain-containing protein [Cellulomonas sp. P5_E12]
MNGVLLATVALGVVILAVLAWMMQKKRQEAFQQWALRNRWTYEGSDPSLVHLSDAQPFGQGRDKRATEVLRGAFDGHQAVSFTYSWTTGDEKDTTNHTAHVVALALPAYLPTVEVTRDGFGAKLDKLFGGQDIQFESEAFNMEFRVTASDAQVGHAIVHPRLMERLLRDGAVTPWRIGGTSIISWEPGSSALETLATRLGLLSAIVRSIPRHVWLDHGHDPLDATIG